MASSAKLVLVDDDPVFLRLLAENLRAAGHAVTAFSDPQAGLAALLRTAPDLCLFDWDMPGLDGLALLRTLRAGGAHYPVLFLTGHASPMFEEAALAAGAVDFIDKSRGPAIVLHRIGLALSRGAAPVEEGEELGSVTRTGATSGGGGVGAEEQPPSSHQQQQQAPAQRGALLAALRRGMAGYAPVGGAAATAAASPSDAPPAPTRGAENV